MAQVEIIKSNLNSKNENTNIVNLKKKVCAYARVSTDNEEQLTSYSSQIKYYTEKIKANPDWEFVGIYADEGISGTQVKNRTEFMRMIDDALNDKIDIIITKSISRFARNVVDTLKYVRELRDNKVDVYFEKENIHTIELDSEMFLTLYSAFAQGESESISQNVKMGFRAKMKRGEPCGKANPYGYDWNKETQELVINEEQAEVVKMIFNWYADGLGGRAIAKKLNSLKIPTLTGKKWEQSTIRHIIMNEKYVGDLCGQKYYTESPITHKHIKNFGEKDQYYVKEHHEAIISRETWNKAQEVLKKRNSKIIPNGSKHPSTYSQKYAFSSKICCGFCGTNFVRRVGSKKKDGSRNVYWQCYQKIYDSKTCEDSVLIREDVLEQAFIEVHNTIAENKFKNKDKLLEAIKSSLEENDCSKEIEKLNNQEEKIHNKLSKLVDMRLEDSIDKNTYLTKENELKTELKDIETKRNELIEIKNQNKHIAEKIKEIEKVLNNYLKPLKEFSRDSFEELIEKIIVGDIDEDGNKRPDTIRFILKTGREIPTKLVKDKKNYSSNKSVSFVEKDKKIFLTHKHHLLLFL